VTNPSGVWSFNFSGIPATGGHSYTAHATLNGVVSPLSKNFLVMIDRTAPTVDRFIVPSTSRDVSPEVRVQARDNVGLANNPQQDQYKVDLRVNGSSRTRVPLNNGAAQIEVKPNLPAGATYALQADVYDLAGNRGTSPTRNVFVGSGSSLASSDDWTFLRHRVPSWDPDEGRPLEQTGNVQVMHALDLDQSPGTSVGHGAHLVYNLDAAIAEPVLQVVLQYNVSVR
jgi:hypothetical protein